jgi:hypothetical protein
MLTYDQWASLYPDAAAVLHTQVLTQSTHVVDAETNEMGVQRQAQLDLAQQGYYVYRNNVGATPSKCKACGERTRPVRYGICNETPQLNKEYKSSDLLLVRPRVIQPEDVGARIAQIGWRECKRPGWTYSGRGREEAQARWLTLQASQLAGAEER